MKGRVTKTGIRGLIPPERGKLLMKPKLTCTMSTSPKVLKYSFRSCSVVFHGRPSTIKSDVFWTALFTFTADEASVSSIFLLLSKQKSRNLLELSCNTSQNTLPPTSRSEKRKDPKNINMFQLLAKSKVKTE